MFVIEVLLTTVTILLAIPVSVLFLQVIAACFFRQKLDETIDTNVSVAVLVPAHDEASGIAQTLKAIAPQLNEQDILLVVADNCSDDTADIARTMGATVIERHNLEQRGKGYALDYGIQHLQSTPKDALLIIDADCHVDTGSIKKMAIRAVKFNRPVQALYLMYRQPGANIKSAIAEFAWTVKNWVRPLGFAKLDLPCQLMGTGMAFPWEVLRKMDLANGHIVEDMKLGVDLAAIGYPPLFYPEAKVSSYFPLTTETQKGQSKRWEHGHLSVIMNDMPALLFKGIKNKQPLVVAMGLDLSIPPLALFVGLLLVVLFICVTVFYTMGMVGLAYTLSVMNFMLMAITIVFAWWGFGQRIISLTELVYIPVYILQKIPNYFSFIFKRQTTWNKTKRDQEVE